MGSFAVGSMVRARGREWVVLPSEDPELLLLRPLGGTDEDARGLYLPLEGNDVAPASLPPPDPAHAGNASAAMLLRDAVRLGFRSAAGPLRSLARVAFEPRPYQLVPLLMALRQDPVRLLIGDDVRRFVVEACARLGAPAARNGAWELDPGRLPAAIRARAELAERACDGPLRVEFALPVPDGVTYLARTHPLVEALASYVLDRALAEPDAAPARRCAAIRTDAVRRRTVLLVLRARFLIEQANGDAWFPMLAEECFLAAFDGDPAEPTWLEQARAEALARAEPTILTQLQRCLRHYNRHVKDAAFWGGPPVNFVTGKVG